MRRAGQCVEEMAEDDEHQGEDGRFRVHLYKNTNTNWHSDGGGDFMGRSSKGLKYSGGIGEFVQYMFCTNYTTTPRRYAGIVKVEKVHRENQQENFRLSLMLEI